MSITNILESTKLIKSESIDNKNMINSKEINVSELICWNTITYKN